MNIQIRRAKPTEANLLGDLSFRSKAYWGYEHELTWITNLQQQVTIPKS
ncbi:hypothetical protein [Hazenella coriacea]|nr:hypothetical protein [Hazenella coriacea]